MITRIHRVKLLCGLVLLSVRVTGGAAAPVSEVKLDADQPQWRQTAGPEGGFILSLLSNGLSLFAGTNGGGVYHSTNNGESWTPANAGIADQRVRSLAVIGTELFAGTDSGVFRSTDNGESWTAVNTGLRNARLSSLAVIGTTIFAGTDSGVFRSANNGESWEAIGTGLNRTTVNAMAVSGTALFAGTEGGGIFRTTNQGESWIAVNNGLPSNARIPAIITSGASLFVGVGGYLDRGAVYRSNNQGESWTALGTGLPQARVSTLAVSGTSLLAGTFGRGIFRLTDDGANWVEANAGLRHGVVGALSTVGTTLFAGTQGGVFRSTDNAGNWTETNAGLKSSTVCSLAVSGESLFAATRESVSVLVVVSASSPGESTKTAIRERKLAGELPANLNNLSDPDRIYRSINRGESWTPFSEGLPKGEILSLAVSGTTLFASSDSGVFRSTDNGESWTAVNTGLPLNRNISALIASGTNLYAGVGGYLGPGAVYRSNNQGESWTALGANLPVRITSLAVSGVSLFAGTLGRGVFHLANSEAAWREANTGLSANTAVSSLAVIGTNIFAGTYAGVYRSTNGGESWTAVNTGLTDKLVTAFATIGTNLYVGTRSGIFRLVQSRENGSIEDGLSEGDQGESWVAVNAGLTNKSICSLATSGPNLLAGTEAGATYISDPVASAMVNVSAASYDGSELALESIAVAFGNGLATNTAGAPFLPLPTSLAGTQGLVRDSFGTEELAPLFYVSSLQANYLVPSGLMSGPATVSLTNADGGVSLGTVRLARVAPGLFAANGNGQGVAVGVALRIGIDGSQHFQPLARFDPGEKKFVSTPIDLGAEGDQTYLILFGTGFRFRSDLSGVKAKIGDVDAPVGYAGPQSLFVGLDQLNVQLSRSLAGRGELVVDLTVDGKRANPVTVNIR